MDEEYEQYKTHNEWQIMSRGKLPEMRKRKRKEERRLRKVRIALGEGEKGL